MKSIKLALIRQKYRPDGGAERFLARAIEALKDDVELTIFTRKWKQQDGVNIVECNPTKWSRVSREKRFAQAVCSEIQKHNFDIIQSHERIPCCDIFRAGDGVHHEWLRQRKRTLNSLQRLFLKISPFHNYVKKVEKQLYNSPQLKAVICISEMVKHDILRYFDFPEDKLHTIYVGIDTDTFSPELKQNRSKVRQELNIPESAPVFIFVGSGFERKGVIQAIKAIPELPNNTHLLIVGKDKKIKRYQNLCKQLGISKQVHFLGVQKDVGPYYGAADALVFPTRYEPFSNVVLEALASGLPVITTQQCGGGELIKNGINGYTIDSLDLQGLIQSMRLLSDKKHCEECSVSARESAIPHTIENVSQQLVKLYKTILNPNS